VAGTIRSRTKPFRFEARHTGFDAEFFGVPVGRNDDAVPPPAAADPNRSPLQLVVERDLATGEEAVAIHVQNPVGCFRAHGQTLIEPKFSPCQILAHRLGQKLSKPM
jgi:hypothetical protein